MMSDPLSFYLSEKNADFDGAPGPTHPWTWARTYVSSAFEIGRTRNSMRPSSSSHTSEFVRNRARTRPWTWARTPRARSSSSAFELGRVRNGMSPSASSHVHIRVRSPPSSNATGSCVSSAFELGRVRNGMSPSSSSHASEFVRPRARTPRARTPRARSSSAALEMKEQSLLCHPPRMWLHLLLIDERSDELASAKSSIQTCWIPPQSVGRADAAGEGGIVWQKPQCNSKLNLFYHEAMK